MSRGTREVARLIQALGGNELSAYGLCHLGDYEATVVFPLQPQPPLWRMPGYGAAVQRAGRGRVYRRSADGFGDANRRGTAISRAVYEVLYHDADIRKTLGGLFDRSLKM